MHAEQHMASLSTVHVYHVIILVNQYFIAKLFLSELSYYDDAVFFNRWDCAVTINVV